MSLETNHNIFIHISRIAQCLAPYALACISMLSALLGRDFYQLKPFALFLATPLLVVLISVKLCYDYYCQDVPIGKAYRKVSTEPSKKSRFLSYEKNIYFFIYFISDILASFELFSILLTPFVSMSIYASYAYLLPLSIVYALYIHLICREPDLSARYEKLSVIMADKPFSIPFSTFCYTLITLLCFMTAVSFFYTPVISIPLFTCALYLSVYHAKQHLQSLYTLYLLSFALQRLHRFQNLLSSELQLINAGFASPVASGYLKLMINGVAFLYAGAYYTSTARNEHISTLSHDPNPKKTDS